MQVLITRIMSNAVISSVTINMHNKVIVNPMIGKQMFIIFLFILICFIFNVFSIFISGVGKDVLHKA